jgi:hypothetical protein
MRLAAALTAATLGLTCAVAQADAGSTLHARFQLAPGLGWTTVRLDPSTAAWHRRDGTPATPAEVRAVLAGLAAVQVGARCASWVDGSTLYPCGFAVEAERPGGGGPALAQAYSETATAAARQRSERDAPAAVRAAGLIAPVLDAPQTVRVTLPTVAVGAQLRLRIRPLSNAMVPSQFEPASGEIVLRGGPVRGAAPA